MLPDKYGEKGGLCFEIILDGEKYDDDIKLRMVLYVVDFIVLFFLFEINKLFLM